MMANIQTSNPTDNLEISPELLENAEAFKALANKLFSEKLYLEAIKKYTDAISSNHLNPVYYSNRAFAYIKMELYGAAIRDADECIRLDPSFIKGYYRRAVANMGLGNLKDAVKDFRNVVKVAPRDVDARKKLSESEKELRRVEFERAISFDEVTKSALELIGSIDDIIVESSYDGPHISNEGITLDFVMDMLGHLRNQKKLHKKYAYKIMNQANDIFLTQPSIVDISISDNAKLTVCGDIHGQFYDLLDVFCNNGYPSENNMYLWNGDFVDRGSFSVECILTLFAFKILYPNSVFLSRGNHETDNMNKVYGFEGEVKAKYSDVAFKFFSEIFNAVPLGNLIQNRILVIHGGLFSRDGVTIDDLRKINRFQQPSSSGLMCELLWSDPQPENGRGASKRGIGLQFGPDVTKAFCELNNLKCIIRSHEVKQGGYEIDHDGRCITIFSAPNYCDSVGNQGAYIHITSDLEMIYNQFSAVPHPPIKPMQYASSLYSQMINLDLIDFASKNRNLEGYIYPYTQSSQTLLIQNNFNVYILYEINSDMLQQIFQLVKKNMFHLYNQSEDMHWNDDEKLQELSEDWGRYIIIQTQYSNVPIAFVYFRFDLEESNDGMIPILYVYELSINEKHQRIGLGKYLMQQVESIAVKLDMRKVMLTVFEQNESALAFYYKLGYKIDEISDDDTDYLILSKGIDGIYHNRKSLVEKFSA